MRYILVFIIGLLFGSFGSVILHRLAHEITRKKIRSVLVGRSECPDCHHTLAWYDLFPLASWLFNRGKCRYCGKRISHRYPLLELGSGLVFLGIFYRWTLFGGGDIALLIIFCFLNWCFYLLMIHDIRTMYLHNAARRMCVAGSVALLAYVVLKDPTVVSLIAAAQRIVVFFLGFIAFYRLAKLYVRLRRKQEGEGIGQGDVMLAPIVGLVLWQIYALMIGTAGMSRIDIILNFWYYVIAACVAALVLLVVTPITREDGKRLIPFFPGMIVGIWIMMAILPWLLPAW